MKVGYKLALVVSAVLFLSIGAGLFGIYKLNQSNNAYANIIRIDYANNTMITSMLVDFKIQVQNWKDTLLRGKDPVKLDKYWSAFQKRANAVDDTAMKLQASLPKEGEASALVGQFAREHVIMGENYRKGLAAFKAANFDPAAGDTSVAGMDRAPSELLEKASKRIISDTDSHVTQISDASKWVIVLSMAIMLAAVMLSALLAWLLIRSITTPLYYAIEVARRIANGDLSSEIQVTSQDEIGELLTALKNMNASLSHIVGEIRVGTESIASASRQIAAGNLDLSGRTEAQAGSLEETASAMEEITSTVKQNADNVHQANQLAENASGVAVKGGAAVSQVSDTMLAINESSRKIADIIGVIDGIAFQTNILALNAAVEAARAGEQGRGFAVVATEVRSLAQRSAAAAKEIKSLIDDSVAKVERGNEQAVQASSTMSAVVSGVQQVTGIMSEISAASREQSQGIEEINRAINQMDETTQQNAALVEQAAAAAKSLQDQAQHLEELVDKFKLNGMRHNSQRTQSKIISTRSANTVQQAGRLAHKQAVSATKKLTATVRNDNEWEEF